MRNSDRILVVLFCFTVSHVALLLTGSTAPIKKGPALAASSTSTAAPATTTTDPEAAFVEQFQKENPKATPAELEKAIQDFHAKNDSKNAQAGELSNTPSVATTSAPETLEKSTQHRRIGKQMPTKKHSNEPAGSN